MLFSCKKKKLRRRLWDKSPHKYFILSVVSSVGFIFLRQAAARRGLKLVKPAYPRLPLALSLRGSERRRQTRVISRGVFEGGLERRVAAGAGRATATEGRV